MPSTHKGVIKSIALLLFLKMLQGCKPPIRVLSEREILEEYEGGLRGSLRRKKQRLPIS